MGTSLSTTLLTSESSMTSNLLYEELDPLEPRPSVERSLAPRVLSDRVAARVAQRDAWPDFDGLPSATSFLRYTCTKVCDLLAFHTRCLPSDLDQTFPMHPVDWNAIQSPPPRLQVTWIGHASVFVQIDGCKILCDPIFSNRCAPTQLAGPLRYRPPAFTVQDLLQQGVGVDAVFISHNHYDHLDYQSVLDLSRASPEVFFVVPLGLKSWFRRYIRPDLLVVELDWHECFPLPCSSSIKITAVPMCHWSNRFGWDIDKSLWCGFIVESTATGQKFLFCGDTGWFDAVKDIGATYGPIDMAAIPIGAYQPRYLMKSHHIDPQEAVELMEAVGARQAVPIHWGTFPLTLEEVMEPRERLVAAMCDAKKDPSTFRPWLIGETVVCNPSSK